MTSLSGRERLGESTVVSGEEDGSGVGRESLLEIFAGAEVKVVGRLVEDEEIDGQKEDIEKG